MKRPLNFFIIFIFLVFCPLLFAENKNTNTSTKKSVSSTPKPKQSENLPEAKAASDATPQVKNPLQKLKRGIVNVVTAPIEIAKGVDEGWKESADQKQPAGTGIFGGFFKGIANTIERMGSGLWDIVSFPFETPAHYEPLMKPDYVLEDK